MHTVEWIQRASYSDISEKKSTKTGNRLLKGNISKVQIDGQSIWVRTSYYSDKFENRPMAGGGLFHQDVPSAATLIFPLNSVIVVTNVEAKKSIILRVTDRGPYSDKYGIDLSKAAWKMLNLSSTQKSGGWVKVELLDEPVNHNYFPDFVCISKTFCTVLPESAYLKTKEIIPPKDYIWVQDGSTLLMMKTSDVDRHFAGGFQ